MSLELAQRALSLREDPCAVLSLGLDTSEEPVTPSSSVLEARRRYMRLALSLHPDKLVGFPKATEAFQVLVRCFEAFANGQLPRAKGKTPRPKKTKKSESNDAKPSPAKDVAKAKTREKRSRIEDIRSESETESSDEDYVIPTLGQYTIKDRAADEKHLRKLIEVKASELTTNQGAKVTRHILGCPKCRTPWQPDTPKFYTFVLAFGAKVHCELCVLEFGWATAQHHCQGCKRAFEYEPGMYTKPRLCQFCKGTYIFPYYAVTLDDIAYIRKKEIEAQEKKRDNDERAERASKRGEGDDEALTMMIGECIINEQCPICRKKVAKAHKAHILSCMQSPPPQKKAQQEHPNPKPARKKSQPAPKLSVPRKMPTPQRIRGLVALPARK